MIILAGWTQPVFSQLIKVPADCPSIQAGIDLAMDGDTVLVADGLYFENISFRGKGITLASHFLLDGDTSHISSTIIDGSHYSNPAHASVVTMSSGEDTTSVLCGFTICGGMGTYISDILLDPAMSSTKYMVGGGILIFRSGGTILNNIVEGNVLISPDSVRGSMGGGVYAEVAKESELILRSNIIRENHIREVQGWGGGLGIIRGKALLEHNVVMNNSINAEWLSVGAGIFFQNVLDTALEREVVIRNNVVSGNTTYSKDDRGIGGGLVVGFIHGEGLLNVHHNLICNNRSNGIGGGFYSFDARGLLSENLIFNNSAGMHGNSIGSEQDNGLNMDFNHIWEGEIWIATHQSNHKLKLADVYGKEFVSHEWKGDLAYSQMFSIDPSTGGLYVGEPGGFISFRPLTVPLNAFAPPVVIFDFRHIVDAEATAGKNRMILSSKETQSKFKFAVLEYAHTNVLHYISNEYQFRYFMKGVDRDTSVTGMDMTAEYLDMEPGHYSFWVTRSTRDGNWSSDGINMDIIIRPPWYMSKIAYGSYAIFLGLVLTGFIRFRTRRLSREKLILEREVAGQTRKLQEKNLQLVEMERLRTRFFTDISHEIRTPLSLIAGPLDHLTRQDYPDPRVHYWLALIQRNSQRLLGMVNQLLDISRLEAGYMKMVLEQSDVIRHVKMVVQEFQSMADSKGIKYIIDIPDRELLVHFDRDKLETVLTNLLSNAFRFTPPSGIVTCRVKLMAGDQDKLSPRMRIIVADTGPGVPAMEREKIFERFFRGNAVEKEVKGGTGIGLALTRELVLIMHGKVLLKSLEGQGSVFIVELPLGMEHLDEREYVLKDPETPSSKILNREEEVEALRSAAVPDSKNLTRILLVEDNGELRAFMAESLKHEYLVLEARDGSQGLEKVLSELPDLVISDVMMPGMDGMELCRRIKEEELTCHIPVILLTAKASSQDRKTGFELGADDYIFKPFRNDELIARIGNLLEQRERLRKRYSSMVGMDWDEITINNPDEEFLKKIFRIISDHLLDPDFNVGRLQEEMAISREHLYRKLMAICGEAPSSLIRKLRLKTAAAMILDGRESITEIALHVGFSNPSHFARSFKKEYGINPHKYRKEPVS